ncbi:hypothetical protein CAPTEDRAFT_205476 [Capitella teleta]|uniref:Protein fem-1 homolog C n=1 Tax=Capitella teleta TaxID=283909 RepID=R7UH56_CAPTE|nr:hypothetical protein CAPTEDRAFT_205476 [Capitella teleta]|eukprot:ELU05423.1 hypothetical protein CAPTEDRAFT_205476 [Capitella teleta]
MISCYKGHLKIVKYLLEKGADVNRKSLKGNTALHDCAESGSLEILKLLLNHTSQFEKDSYGMSPMLAAAVTGHVNVVQYLIGHTQSPRKECIEALELLGATFVDKKRDMIGALTFWKLAMEQRLGDKTNIIEKPVHKSPIAAYENSVEAKSMEELDDLIREPDDMRMQALLVRERILGPAHPETSYYIRYRGAVYADAGEFDRCITLWMYALGMQQEMLDPLSPMTQSSFSSFAELFTFMMSEGRNRKPHPVAFPDMMVVFDKAVQELEDGISHLGRKRSVASEDRDAAVLHQLLVVILHFICLACRNKQNMTERQLHTFKCSAYRLVQLRPIGSKGFTPLHLACSRQTTAVGRYPLCSFPSPEVVDLLIEVGAPVNEVEFEKNTPLHIAAMNRPCNAEIIKLLLENGAHIDARNSEHKTSMDLLDSLSMTDISVSPLKYRTLQCLAARQIMAHNIAFEGQIPKKLEDFVLMH